MLLHAESFLANLDLLRTCVITGPKGTGKDLLASELSAYYLDRGYRFFSNQPHVWNDQPWRDEPVSEEEFQALRAAFVLGEDGIVRRQVEDRSHSDIAAMLFGEVIPPVKKLVALKPIDIQELRETYYRDESGALWRRVADVKRMVIQLTEGGRYLRAWKYFENLYEMTRKTQNYLFVPSIRLPHDEICEMVCENTFPFSVLGFRGGGVWTWQVGGQNLRKPVRGWFLHFPGEVGLYDTLDYSSRPDEIIKWFTREIERPDVTRDELSAVASNSAGGAAASIDEAAAVARRIQNAALSLQDKD